MGISLPPAGADVRVSIVVPLYNGERLTRACVDSLDAAGWNSADELILVDNCSTDGTRAFLATLGGAARVILNEENRNFAGATNQGVSAARGRWVLLLNNDTEVTPGWLDAMIDEAESTGADIVGARLLYPDGRIQHAGVCVERGVFPRHLHRFAPGDSSLGRDSYECQMVTAACLLVRRDLYLESGGMDEAFRNGCEDIDFCFRARAEHGALIRYCGRAELVHHESVSPGRNDHDEINAQIMLERWGDRLQADRVSGDRIIELACPTLPWRRPQVHHSIVIPLHNRLDMSKACVESLIMHLPERTEIVLVDNASTDGTVEWCEEICGEIRVLRSEQNINFSGACNMGAAQSLGEHVIFLNNDTIVTEGWLEALVAPLADARIGVVGARLLYPDGTIQHAGVAYGPDKVGFHVNAGAAGDDPVVMQPRLVQSVTGACMAVRRGWFYSNTFDTEYRNGCEDLDLCLRALEQGRGVWYEPSCVVYHHESQTAGRFNHASENLARFLERWGSSIVADADTFDHADQVAEHVQRYPYEGGPWPGMHAIPELVAGEASTALVVTSGAGMSAASLKPAVGMSRVDVVDLPEWSAESVNAVLSTTSSAWVVLAPAGSSRRGIQAALSGVDETEPLTGLAPRSVVAFDDETGQIVLGIALDSLDRAGGANPDYVDGQSHVRDLANRLALHGVPSLEVRVPLGGEHLEPATWSPVGIDRPSFAHAWLLAPQRATTRTVRLYEPFGGRAGDARDVEFETRSHVVLVACDDAGWPGYRDAVRGVLSRLTQHDDVTVIVRSVDLGAACSVLEVEAAGIPDDELVDVVLVEGDASLDPALCELADLVIVDSSPGIALHGCAWHHRARCLLASDASRVRTLLEPTTSTGRLAA